MSLAEQPKPTMPDQDLEARQLERAANLEAGKEQGQRDFQAEQQMSDKEKMQSKIREREIDEGEKIGHDFEALRAKVEQEKAKKQAENK